MKRNTANVALSDAAENLSGFDIEVEITEGEDDEEAQEGSGDDDDEEGEDEGLGAQRPIYSTATAKVTPFRLLTDIVSREQVLQLLGRSGIRQLFATGGFTTLGARYRGGLFADDDEDEDEDDDDDDNEDEDEDDEGSEYARATGYDPVGPRRRRKRGRAVFEKVPSDTGRELMNTGTFGSENRPTDNITRKKKLAYNVMQRELGLGSDGRQRNANRLMRQGMIPESAADTIIHYNSACYSGQFSDDGNFFFACTKDFHVRMYDTSNPYDWKYYKSVVYPYGQWTITDASLSRDNRFLAYSSIRSAVCLAPTDPNNESEPHLLEFANTGTTYPHGLNPYFGIWSIRFSGDGREIVAGTNDSSVYVYDIERRQSILRIPGHEDDVNAVCFGDSQSPHILYSGSDDTTIKVWDRRSMGDGREAGVFLGHTAGLTFVDSKGDGRYVLSNGKDQTAKLWDLRKMMSKENADRVDINAHSMRFDYRNDGYDNRDYRPHPHDCSLVTFRGHKVLRTLIRCHFSPSGSTDSRYVYSGSYDGSVYIWNMDATLAGKINVLKASKNSRSRDADIMAETYDFPRRLGGDSWNTCVRDASWHPNAPVIAG